MGKLLISLIILMRGNPRDTRQRSHRDTVSLIGFKVNEEY